MVLFLLTIWQCIYPVVVVHFIWRGPQSFCQQISSPTDLSPKVEEILNFSTNKIKLQSKGASLVAQWLRICLPMQGTWVQALVREDPTCRGATKPVCHNYWACALEPASHNYWAHVPQLLKPACLEHTLCNKRSHCNEKSVHLNKE